MAIKDAVQDQKHIMHRRQNTHYILILLGDCFVVDENTLERIEQALGCMTVWMLLSK